MSALLDIGDLLVVTRRASRVTQRELAEKLGVTQQQVARWEARGYRTATVERVSAAAEALGVEIGLVGPSAAPLAAEAGASYSASSTVAPVRDLGEIAARLRAHSDVLRERFLLDRIGVFGSFAVGEQDADSDIDLVVESADPGGFRWVGAAEYVEEVLGRKVDWSRLPLLKPRMRDRVARETVYVWPA